jgi:hypothetical protein
VLIPFATRPAQPMYWRFTPAVASPPFSCPAAANLLTSLIAASASHDARFNSRWVRSGLRSPACGAIVHPFRYGSSLTSADT